jgi:hypothetical protein
MNHASNESLLVPCQFEVEARVGCATTIRMAVLAAIAMLDLHQKVELASLRAPKPSDCGRTIIIMEQTFEVSSGSLSWTRLRATWSRFNVRLRGRSNATGVNGTTSVCFVVIEHLEHSYVVHAVLAIPDVVGNQIWRS